MFKDEMMEKVLIIWPKSPKSSTKKKRWHVSRKN
jgi:hypothetical protein